MSSSRTILFLGDEAAQRASAAFTTVVGRMGLPWKSEVRKEPGDTTQAAAVVAFAPVSFTHPALAIWNESEIEREVNDLVAKLLGGKKGCEAPPPLAKPAPPKKVHTVRIAREVAGRRGKGVTTIWDLPLNEAAIKDLAASLKQKCGTGGTVKDGKIEIQGDHRDRIEAELEKLGYKVKRSGG